MSLRDQSLLRVVLYEGQDAAPLESEARFDTVSRLLNQGFGFTRVGSGGATAPADDRAALVLGRFPEGLAPRLGDGDTVAVQDVSGLTGEQVLAAVQARRAARQTVQPGTWKPWFPVIDYDRCTNCMQCLSVCLFGVYGADREGHMLVLNQDN